MKLFKYPLPEAAAMAYAVLFCMYYLSDPLSLAPQLDAQENLRWADLIMAGALPDEPLYRAMLYPLFIGMVKSVIDSNLVLQVCGLLMHIGIAFQVRCIAAGIWKNSSAGRSAFILYLVNPVLLFYSMQLLDMTMGMVFFFGAVQVALSSRLKHPLKPAVAGMLTGLACLTRPNFLPAALVLAISPFLSNKADWKSILPESGFTMLGLFAILGLQGLFNLGNSGEFKMLPTQGTFDLYAANRDISNGLYLTHSIDVSQEDFINPTKAESDLIYGLQTGNPPPYTVQEKAKHWKSMAWQMFREEPNRVLKLLAFKAYAVLNAYETYNNLTFSFHKSRIPPLKYNPINFGLIFILAVAGSIILAGKNRPQLAMIMLLLASYAFSLVLYYASARLRLPIVPLLTILAGGVFVHWRSLWTTNKQKVIVSVACLTAGFVTFSSFGGIRSKDTYIQDRLLLANAHAELGNDVEAAQFAKSALLEQPNRKEAQRVYTISYFNMRLLGNPSAEAWGSWREQKQWVIQKPPTDPVQDVILGVYNWQWGDPAAARKIWQEAVESNNEGTVLAEACLKATSGQPTSDPLTLALKRLLNKE